VGHDTDTLGISVRRASGAADNPGLSRRALSGSKPSPSVQAGWASDIGSNQVNDTKPKVDAGTPQRRRVLRGVIAAPVVLTISSGASASMTSNLRCVANQVNNPTSLPRAYGAGNGVPSTVIRVPIYRLTAGGALRYVSGTDICGLAHPNRPVTWISNGQWRTFDVATNTMGSTNLSSPGPTTATGMFATVQMDQSGYVMSVGKNSASTSMLAATCWNSFRAGPIA
jgi:hypothetical protein